MLGILGILGNLLDYSMDDNFVNLAGVPERRLEFLWRGRIPLGAITVVEGDPGSSKSTLMYDIAARVSSGRPMPDSDVSRSAAAVILLQAEDPLDAIVVPNLRCAGADLMKISASKNTSASLLSDELVELEQEITSNQAKLVVIDPFAAFVVGGLNNDQSVRRILCPLAGMAERTGTAIVLVRHLRKSGARTAAYSGIGSIALAGAARSCLLVAHDPGSDDPYSRVLALTKSNVGNAPSLSFRTAQHANGTISIVWNNPCECTADELLLSKREEIGALNAAKLAIYTILKNGPVPAREVLRIAEKMDVSERTLKRAKRLMKVPSRSRNEGRKAYRVWKFPNNPGLIAEMKAHELTELYDELFEKAMLPDSKQPSPDNPGPRGTSDDEIDGDDLFCGA